MIIHSSYPAWNFGTVCFFQEALNQEILFLDESFTENFFSLTSNHKNDNELVCFIPVFGDEELDMMWVKFFDFLSKQQIVIGFDLFIFVYGTNDPINLNFPFFRQIDFYCRFLSFKKHIFPLKLFKTNKIDDSVLFSFYSQEKRFSREHTISKLIKQTIFDSKDFPLSNTKDILDLTSELNKFDSLLKKLRQKRKRVTLFLEECTTESLLINRAELFNRHIKISKCNPHLKRLHLRSNHLTEFPNVSLLGDLKVINLSANKLTHVTLANNVSDSIEIVDLSKNLITSFEITRTFENLTNLILFNNPFVLFNVSKEYLPNIKQLNIGRIPSTKFLPEVVFTFDKLESLCISYLTLDFFDERILLIESLKYLDVRGTTCVQNNFLDILHELQKKGVQIVW